MPYQRVWDASCPQVYDRWEADGTSWVIQDLLPDYDEEAVQLLLAHLASDEVLCCATGITGDENSMRCMGEFWRQCLALRTSIACYAHKSDTKTLAAVNCCLIISADDKEDDRFEIKGESWQNVYNALHYAETRVNVFELLGLDRVLYGMGLVVQREYRGAKLGARILAAREPLCRSQGVLGTSTVFTGAASQRSAERAGFTTVAAVSFKELSDAGLRYPHDENTIKLMVKKYDGSQA